MYNKIASIILNSGKNPNYAGEVFVAQPDSAKEKLAGKIFVLAELEGRKNDSQKIINFLVNFFDYNYYGDEKILLRDKIEGLNIENIFESVLAKVNKGLLDFLQEERLKIDPYKTNLTLGVVYENKLYFSSYGKNKAFLVFRRQGNYEIINIETTASDLETGVRIEGEGSVGKIFSTVINGEIPEYSYFLFVNEALPEYLSNKELVNIITKLPPMVAAEQIKNSLQKINSFAPFLGIIVKSTIGLNVNEASDESEIYNRVAGDQMVNRGSSRNAHSSISHLNYTEQRTERMLAPAGIISPSKIIKAVSSLFSRLMARKNEDSQKIVKFYEDDGDEQEVKPVEPSRQKQEQVRRDSFLMKDKLIFKRKTSEFIPKLLKVIVSFAIIISPTFWVGIYKGLAQWIKGLNKRNKILVGAVFLCLIVLIGSISYSIAGRKTRIAQEEFQKIITDINGKQEQIDSYLLYDNQMGALSVLNEANNLLEINSPISKEQIAEKEALQSQLQAQKDKIQKVTQINSFEDVTNLNVFGATAQADNITFLKNKLYLADSINKSIYAFTLLGGAKETMTLGEQLTLSSPAVKGDFIYYSAANKIVKVSGSNANVINLDASLPTTGNFIQTYKDYLYVFNNAKKEIYRFSDRNSVFGNKSTRLSGDDLSAAIGFNINEKGEIFVTKDSSIVKFFNGKKQDFNLADVDPSLRITRVIVTTNNIYVLDINNNRLISFNNNGAVVKQYRLVKDALKDFAVSDDGKSAYILAGTGVYKFPL